MILGRFAEEDAALAKAGYHGGEVAHRPSDRWPAFPWLVFKGGIDSYDEWCLRVLEGEPIAPPTSTMKKASARKRGSKGQFS